MSAAFDTGNRVVATTRGPAAVEAAFPSGDERLFATTLGVTDPSQVDPAVENVKERFGTIDGLVNNAGCGQVRAFEQLSHDLVAREVATNVAGTTHLTRAVLPLRYAAGSASLERRMPKAESLRLHR
jgi:NAD(P)-dependent dehydrogenase (short-subunit alcohol dehydrogenase family)